MRNVHVPLREGYEILIGPGLLGQAGARIAEKFSPSRIAVITEGTVDARYADALRSSLQNAGLSPCT